MATRADRYNTEPAAVAAGAGEAQEEPVRDAANSQRQQTGHLRRLRGAHRRRRQPSGGEEVDGKRHSWQQWPREKMGVEKEEERGKNFPGGTENARPLSKRTFIRAWWRRMAMGMSGPLLLGCLAAVATGVLVAVTVMLATLEVT